MTYEVGVAPALRLGFQDRDTDVRLTSVTSGLKGALGIRLGSVGLPGWTGAPNSETKKPTPICMIEGTMKAIPGFNFKLDFKLNSLSSVLPRLHL